MSSRVTLADVLDQEQVYIVQRSSGRSGNKIHATPNCSYLQRKDVTIADKPAASYPTDFHDLCGSCTTPVQRRENGQEPEEGSA